MWPTSRRRPSSSRAPCRSSTRPRCAAPWTRARATTRSPPRRRSPPGWASRACRSSSRAARSRCPARTTPRRSGSSSPPGASASRRTRRPSLARGGLQQVLAARRLELLPIAREARLDERHELEDLRDGPARADVAVRKGDRDVELPEPEAVRGVGVELEDDLGLQRRVAEIDLRRLLLARRANGHHRVRIAHAHLERRVGALQRGRRLRVDAELAQEQAEVRVDILGILEVRHRTGSIDRPPRGYVPATSDDFTLHPEAARLLAGRRALVTGAT